MPIIVITSNTLVYELFVGRSHRVDGLKLPSIEFNHQQTSLKTWKCNFLEFDNV